MAEPDLEELARASASSRQLIGTVLAAIVLVPAAGWLFGGVIGASTKGIAAAVLGALVAAMAIGIKIPTPADRFPTIRALRDRAAEVAYVVVVSRGKHILGLVDRTGEPLAKPLVLKGVAAAPSPRNAGRVIAAQNARLDRALAIIARRCPQARVARTSDVLGFRSFRGLAKRAIGALPPG